MFKSNGKNPNGKMQNWFDCIKIKLLQQNQWKHLKNKGLEKYDDKYNKR